MTRLRQLDNLPVSLLVLVLCWASWGSAQTLGNIFYGTGPPPKTIYLVPPTSSTASPAPAPATAQAPAPGAAQLPSPPVDESTYVLGPCYCTPARGSVAFCFVNMTLSASANTTTTECETPLTYACLETTAAPGVYAQQSGPIFNCSTQGLAPAYSPLPVLPAAVQSVGVQNYTLLFQPNRTGNASGPPIRYAQTPIIQAGQILSINPRPPSVGLQFAGVDITVNGELNGLPLEPPNPSICVGNGFLMEVTNDVLIVYNATDGSVVTRPTDFQRFFGVSGPPVNGLSDPFCLYDASDSKRFFVSMSFFSCRSAACLAKGAVRIFSYLLVAVSKTSDPRDGFFGPYYIATDGINPDTNEPYPGFADCGIAPLGFTGKGCLGDFPNPALDKYGYWFSMNMFTIDADNLIGANLFGVRKQDLITGRVSRPSVVTYTNWAPYPGFTIMPSVTQATWNHSRALGGSIFLMSSDSFSYTGQTNDSLGIPSIRTWAVTNTSLLGQNFPHGCMPVLSAPMTLLTQPLQFTSLAMRDPRAPSGTSVPQPSGPILGAQDERMRQVSFSGGYLYSCFNTPVNITSRIYDGFAYFVLAPNFTSDGAYTARIVQQGYVTTAGAHLLNCAITASSNGSMIITGSIVGYGMYLSAFYAHILPNIAAGPIHVPRPSSNPLLNEGPGQLPQRRSGDYSVATLDEGGKAWIVAEWAADRYTNLQQPDTKNPRFANWGTYIMQVNPFVLD